MNYEQKFKELDQYVQMETPEDINNFEFTVWDLAKIKDLKIFMRLISYFDDHCKYLEVMWSLIHALEQEKPYDIYVKSFLCMVNPEIENRKEWMEIILYRLLNDEECLDNLKNNIHLANQEVLLKLLNKIGEESIDHQSRVKTLKSILEK